MKRSFQIFILTLCAAGTMGSGYAQSSDDTRTSNQMSNQPGHLGDTKVAPDLNRVTKIIGTDVVDAQGKTIGDIKDVVLDRSRGQVAYAVVSFGGLMGVGSKYFAIPWKSLQANADNKYVLNVDKDKLKNAPGFDKDHWPDMASEQWNKQTYRYYNQTPYWEGRSASRSGRGASSGMSSGSSKGSSDSTGTSR